jgi:hypothetical protein
METDFDAITGIINMLNLWRQDRRFEDANWRGTGSGS